MSVKPIISSIDSNNNVKKYKTNIVKANYVPAKSVSFQGGANPVVGLMDFIEAGGFAASFIIQDGLGFIAPLSNVGMSCVHLSYIKIVTPIFTDRCDLVRFMYEKS